MKNYWDLYLKCDVLLLVHVFLKKFRYNSLKNYGLYPSHYLSAPGLIEMQFFISQNMSLNLFQILLRIQSLKKVRDTEFRIFLIDIAKPTVSI